MLERLGLQETLQLLLPRADYTIGARPVLRFDHESMCKELTSELRQIEGSPHRLEEIRIRSYYHTNGFFKLVLEDAPCYKLRLHIWPRASGSRSYSEQRIHNHRWNYASFVLSGQISIHHYLEGQEGEEMDHYFAFPRQIGEYYELSHQGTKILKHIISVFLPRGSCYILDSSIAHSVITDDRVLTSTLMLQGPPLADHSSVFYAQGSPVDVRLPASSLSIHQLLDLLVTYSDSSSPEATPPS
jgi:hypothetical protein